MIRKGTLKAFDSATWTATVQITGSLSVWLDSVPVNRAIASGDMIAGRAVAVLFLDPGSPSDTVVLAVWT